MIAYRSSEFFYRGLGHADFSPIGRGVRVLVLAQPDRVAPGASFETEKDGSGLLTAFVRKLSPSSAQHVLARINRVPTSQVKIFEPHMVN